MVRGTTINNPHVIKLISIISEAQGTFIQKHVSYLHCSKVRLEMGEILEPSLDLVVPS
jgi:hypothetical protein